MKFQKIDKTFLNDIGYLKSENTTPLIKEKYVTGYINSKIGFIPVISTGLTKNDIIDGFKVRWGFNRMGYLIKPGIYAIGTPDESSQVFVTANYKLTFDKLRKELSGLNVWILILDTKGVNVWCAAGKGTFGTEELISKINTVRLKNLVNHTKLILPQLGAVGVSAHIIKKETGFKVIYGPVYAKDIKEYINNNYNKNDKMKEVFFTFKERLAVIPVEITQSFLPNFIIFMIALIFSIIESKGFPLNLLKNYLPLLGAVISGIIITPAILPFIPFRSFALKGMLTGLLWGIISTIIFSFNIFNIIAYLLVIPAISAFGSLNYTGASTFTSVAGAKFEVKIALPIIIISIILSILLKTFSIIIRL